MNLDASQKEFRLESILATYLALISRRLCLLCVRKFRKDCLNGAAGYLKEAIECVLQPKACLLSCSSCVDAMLKERGIGGDDLFSRINKAIDTGILTKDMEKWLHHLRLVGNKIRHIENPDPTVGEAKEALEYVTIMAELLYVYPKKLAELKARKEGVVGSKAGDPNSQP